MTYAMGFDPLTEPFDWVIPKHIDLPPKAALQPLFVAVMVLGSGIQGAKSIAIEL